MTTNTNKMLFNRSENCSICRSKLQTIERVDLKTKSTVNELVCTNCGHSTAIRKSNKRLMIK